MHVGKLSGVIFWIDIFFDIFNGKSAIISVVRPFVFFVVKVIFFGIYREGSEGTAHGCSGFEHDQYKGRITWVMFAAVISGHSC